MTNRQFLIGLLGTSALTAAILFGLFQVELLQAYKAFGWVSMACFIALTLLMFMVGKAAAKSNNKNNFTNLIMGFTMGKMMLAVIVVLLYQKLAQPADNFFIIPFFAVYLCYTGLETYMMLKLSKS